MRTYAFIHRICFPLSFALILPMAQAQSLAPPLRQAVEEAWQRSPQARMLEARRDEMRAGADLARSWVAGSPTIGLTQWSDRWTEQHGLRENEISVSAPIWLPGQKSAREALAQTSADDLEAEILRTRLTLAGEVRERLWAVAAAREMLAEAQDHQSHLEAIADEVERRVKAGDLARVDGMLATQEVLAAQAATAAAHARLQEAAMRYRLLTGQQEIPAPQPEPTGQALQGPHPLSLAAHAELRRARASLNVVNRTRSDPPTIGLAMRHERDNPAVPSSRSVGITIQIPIGTPSRNLPLEYAARTELKTAVATLALVEVTVQADVEMARRHLAVAEQALQSASKRTHLAREHAQLIEKAFRLGERGLNELLRTQSSLHEAEVNERHQQVSVGLARARLNQALGIMP